MTLAEVLLDRDNLYDQILEDYCTRTGRQWTERAGSNDKSHNSISIVIPSYNNAYSIGHVLEALHCACANRAISIEVIVVDDASTDDSLGIARHSRMRPKVISFPKRMGPSMARNVGVAIAKGDTILFLDADMLLPSHVLNEFEARAGNFIGIGFRHNIPEEDLPVCHCSGSLVAEPNLDNDMRVRWTAKPSVLIHTGQILSEAITTRPLDETNDLRELGNGRTFYDWDLPRMVVTALMSVPRVAVMRVGGFDNSFATDWGMEDTHLGAKLIAGGLKVLPIRTAVAFHINAPDNDERWKLKIKGWQRNIIRYRARLAEEYCNDATDQFLSETREQLRVSKIFSHQEHEYTWCGRS